MEYPSFVNVRTNRQIEIRNESLSIARNMLENQNSPINQQQQHMQNQQPTSFQHPLLIFEPTIQVNLFILKMLNFIFYVIIIIIYFSTFFFFFSSFFFFLQG